MEACNNRRGRPPQSIFWRSPKTQVLELSQALMEFDWIDRHQKAQTKICLILAKLKSFQCLSSVTGGFFSSDRDGWRKRMAALSAVKNQKSQKTRQGNKIFPQFLKIWKSLLFSGKASRVWCRDVRKEKAAWRWIFFLSSHFGLVERVKQTLSNTKLSRFSTWLTIIRWSCW